MTSVFSLIKRKITVFPESLKNDNFDALYAELTKISFFVDGMNTRLPIPKDAPEEIPRIILNSPDNKISCQIGLKKIQIDWISEAFSDAEAVTDFASEILEKTIGTRAINRVGNIAEYSLEIPDEKSFVSFLAPTVFKDLQKKLEGFTFDLTLNDQISIKSEQETRCNRFAKFFSATRDADGQKLIVIAIDFNTHPEALLSWSVEDFKEFINHSEEKLLYNDIAEGIIV